MQHSGVPPHSPGAAPTPAGNRTDTHAPRAPAVEPAAERTQRTMRFTPGIDTKLRELAEMRGIDLNATVSAAICEDWVRLCRRG